MPEGDILHDTAGDCSDKELLTARLPALNYKKQMSFTMKRHLFFIYY